MLSRVAINKKEKTVSVGEDMAKLEHLYAVGGNKMGQLLWKRVWRFLKKLKIKLLYDPAIPLLVIIKNNSNQYLEDIFAPMFIVALFTITQDVG